MSNRWGPAATLALVAAAGIVVTLAARQTRQPAAKAVPDAVADAQTPQAVPAERPEQRKTDHDRSDVFAPNNAPRSSEALVNQADQGRILGFDLYRDPVGAMGP